MSIDKDGMTMNANSSQLPRECKEINQNYHFEVHAGTDYAQDTPGNIFGYDLNEFEVEPCSLVQITLVNDDDIRHQWMIHGLPRYIYPGGMFHLEAAGGQSRTGSFIVPGNDATLLVHCDMAQHMEKGMKAQLIVGKGGKDLWAVAGVSSPFLRADYLSRTQLGWLIISAILAALGVFFIAQRRRS